MLRVLCLFAVSVVTVACGKETSFVAKDFPCLVDLPGWNQDLMNMHKQLYLGYVNSANELTKKLQQIVQEGKEKSLEFGALKRRLAWEMDGMRLHELYFENLGRKGNPSSLFIEKVSKDFGSFDAWKQDFIATGLMRGIGWVVLYRDHATGKLENLWVNEHYT